MTVWKLQELRELIESKHGEEQLAKATDHINSVDWKIRSASYHSYVAKKAFDSVFSDIENTAMHAIKMILSTGQEASDFNEAKFIYETNVIACAQAIHSISDIISHVILDSVLIENVDEENLDLKAIQKMIPPSKLKQSVVRILGKKSYLYLRDFVNTTKHVRLVGSGYAVDVSGEDKYPNGVKFRGFICKNRDHAAKWGEDFLLELRQLSVDFVDLGQNINDHLSRN
jgi:hypothetical protein